MLFVRSLVTLVALVLAVASAPAVETPEGLLDMKKVVAEARSVTRAKYPNANDVLVDDVIRMRYEPDGRSVTVDDTCVKVLTEKGKREHQSLTFHFTLPYSKVNVKRVEIVKPDGTVVPIDVARQSRVMVDRSQMGSNIYNPNNKILRVGVPGLEVGDLVRYVVVRELVKPRVPKTWSEYEVLEYDSPIKRLEIEIDAPKSLPLRRLALLAPVKGTVKHSREAKGDRIVYTWTATNVPRAFREPSMPPLYTVVQRLLVSTTPSWRDISKWYWRLSKPHLDKTTPAMKKKVEELTRGLKTREAKIAAIFRFVSQQIRYMGITIEKEAPGYEPHDVDLTFNNRYGVCRDKAALLVAMLRLAGFKAFPVLIHNGPKKDKEVPQPFFNHAISCVANPDGSYRLMDSTDENTKRLLPSYLCDKSYLVARPEGEKLLTSPIVPATKNLVRIETRARLRPDGGLTATSRMVFDGINDNVYRGYFARLRPEERRRFFEARAKSVVAGARLTRLEILPKDMTDTTKPFTVDLTLEAPDVLVTDGKTAMLPVPRWGARVGVVNFILRRTGLAKRKYPLKTDMACGARETITLDVKGVLGKPLALPSYTDIDTETVAWRRSLALKGDGILTGGGEFLLKVVEFSPKQYLGLKRDLKAIEYEGRKTPIFACLPGVKLGKAAVAAAPKRASGQDGSDIVILSDETSMRLKDGHTWSRVRTVKKKVLTYAGRKHNSELKLDYNPVWEDVKVESAVVISPKGERQSVTAKEMNVMDAGWVGAAPRYPAGKTLVISLPGVEVGSVIEHRIRTEKRNRPFFSGVDTFRAFDPIRRARLTLAVPKGLALKRFVHKGGLDLKDLSAKAGEGGATITYETKDVPAVTRERRLPPWWSLTPCVFLSSGDWAGYAKAVDAALRKAAAKQPKAEAKGNTLAAKAGGARAKVKAIRDFVAREVRAVGPGLGELPLSTLTPADRSLAEGYGNSPDRAVLLFAMLRAAGLKPEFVLASWGSEVIKLREPYERCPELGYYNTVLVRLKLEDEMVYLNDTDQYAALGATAHDGAPGLVLPGGARFTIRAAEGLRDRETTHYTLKLDVNGDAVIERITCYYGMDFADFHRTFAEMTPEKRRRHYQEVVSNVSQAAVAEGPLTTSYNTYPGCERFTVRAPRFAVKDGKYLYFRLPAGLGGLMGRLADRRENPLYWPAPRRETLSVRIELPKGWRKVVLSPPDVEWAAPEDAGRVTVRAQRDKDGLLTVTSEADLKPAVIPPSAYPKLLGLQQRLTHPSARTVLVERE